MSAREELLRLAPRWTEHEAEIALKAVAHESTPGDEDVAEGWGDSSALKAALNSGESPDDD